MHIDSKAERASKILTRIIQQLEDQKFSGFKMVLHSTPANWHTDGSFPLIPREYFLRMTFATGRTTQFFVPTNAERDAFITIGDEESILQKIEEISSADPNRILKGEPYDVCIFHNGTIHKGPGDCDDSRILLTITSDEQTIPVALQFSSE